MGAMLLRPFNYLAVRHQSSTLPVFNWGIPCLASLITVAVLIVWPSINVFHAGGLLDKTLGFIQNMPGFYLAALAAVATFAKADLDSPMPGPPLSATVLYNGKPTVVTLTRRRFLCMMFAYLTALSILLTGAAIALMAMVEPLRLSIDSAFIPGLRLVVFSVFMLFFAQMVLITFWGLYYLGERIHTPDL